MDTASNSSISRQTWLSLLILLILASIAGAIFAVQFRFNPAVMLSTGDPVSSTTVGKPPPAAVVETLVALPAGIAPLTPPEAFSPDRMSDKINGKAELYLSAGCQGLRSQRFIDSSVQERWMEMFVFDMQTYENAFAVYSSQKRDDAQPMGLTPHAYRTENALYFIHGGYYVELIASEAGDAVLEAMEKIARNFLSAHKVRSATMAEPELFPTAGLDGGRVRMIAADAFGFARLDRIFTAVYRTEEVEITAFLSNRRSEQDAAELAVAYRDFLLQFGGTDITAQSEPEVPGAVVIEILGFNEIIFTHGPYLAGVHEAADLPAAENIARQLYARLKDGGLAK